MRALCRQRALTSPIALRLGPFLSRFAGEDEGRDLPIFNFANDEGCQSSFLAFFAAGFFFGLASAWS